MKKRMLGIRSAILVWLTHRLALPVLRLIRKPNLFHHSMDDLEACPDGSLGKDLYLFLRARNLPLLSHYARHDLKHVLLGYDTTEEGEVCLQSFMLGSGRVSFPVLATVGYGMVTMPEHWKKMKQAFQKGKEAVYFHDWNWNGLMTQPTMELRKKIFQPG